MLSWAKIAHGGSFEGPWGTFRVIQPEVLAMVGRPYPLKAILKKRRKIIKPILRNQHANMTNWGAFKDPRIVPTELFK